MRILGRESRKRLAAAAAAGMQACAYFRRVRRLSGFPNEESKKGQRNVLLVYAGFPPSYGVRRTYWKYLPAPPPLPYVCTEYIQVHNSVQQDCTESVRKGDGVEGEVSTRHVRSTEYIHPDWIGVPSFLSMAFGPFSYCTPYSVLRRD